mgnify:CR=1 FL=1
MSNKKTTIAGILTLLGAIASVAATFLTGGDIGGAINAVLIPAITGIVGLGLLAGADGGV